MSRCRRPRGLVSEGRSAGRAQRLAGDRAMDLAALRNHAKEMLLVSAADLERPQSDHAQEKVVQVETGGDLPG